MAEITGRKYRRENLRYASDTADDEWTIIAPFLPPEHRCGRPRMSDLPAVVNAIRFIVEAEYQWRDDGSDRPSTILW